MGQGHRANRRPRRTWPEFPNVWSIKDEDGQPLLARQPLTDEAWAGLGAALCRALLALGDDQYLVIAQKRTNRFVQFAGQGRFGMRIEAVGNQFLDRRHRLSPAQESELMALGWHPPTYVRRAAPDEPTDGSCNYYIDAAAPVPVELVARLAVYTLQRVFGVRHPGDLEYRAYGDEGEEYGFPQLGVAPARDDETDQIQ